MTMSSTSKELTSEQKEDKEKWVKIFGSKEHPSCWGLDDCSTLMLITCKHSKSCGGKESVDWQSSAHKEWTEYLKNRKK